MSVFTAISATFNFIRTALMMAGGGALGSTLAGYYAAGAGAALLTGAIVAGVSRGISKSLLPDVPSGTTGTNAGTRVQLAPDTGYRVPVVYGTAFQNGIITDAAITSDNQTMTYVLTLGEKTDGTTTCGDIFWNDKKLVFGSSTSPNVTSTIDEDGTTSTDYANNVEVYVYDGFGDNPIRGTVDAYTLVDHWTSTEKNSGTIFAVVKVTYDPEAQLTGLGTMTFHLTNSINNPADVLDDFLINTRYGAGIASGDIDSTSLQQLRSYSNELIDYTDQNGVAQQQARYTLNGIVNAAEDVRTTIDRMLTACNSFFTYDAKLGKWKVTPNKTQSTNNIPVFNDDNVLSEYKFSSTALGSNYNSVEVEFPDKDQKDKSNYATIDLPANLRETNEPDNGMTLRMEFVNNNVQAEYLANQQLRQTRDDLVVMFTADYTTLGVDAGDLIKIFEDQVYGQNNKVYRVVQTVEKEADNGMLTIEYTCIEYNSDVYTVEPITEFTPAPNSDIALFNRVGTPTTPTVDNERSLLSLPAFDINTNTPASGIYTRAEAWFDTNSNMSSKKLLATYRSPTTIGTGTEVEFTIKGLASGTYYYQTRVGNDEAFGPYSSTSSAHNWTANVLINPITIIDSNEPVLTATNGKLVVNTGSIGTTYLSSAVNTILNNAASAVVVPTYNYFTTTNAAAPSDSVFNSQVGRDPIEDDIVVSTKSGDTTVQKGYIHNGTNFVENTNFFSGGLITDGTIGADAIVANTITTDKLNFTPVTSVAGQTGAAISTAQLSSQGLRLTTDAVATSLLSGTVGEANGGTGRTSTSAYVADLNAQGLRLTSETVDTGLLTGSAIPESLGGTGVTSRSAMYSADGVRLTSQTVPLSQTTGVLPTGQGGTGSNSLSAMFTAEGVRLDSQLVPFADVSGSVPESQGGTGSTSLSAALTAEGVRFSSQTIPFNQITGAVPQNQGGTGSTSFLSALTAQGVGFVSGSSANLGDLATLDNITLAKVTNAGTLAGLNAAVLGTNTSGTLPEGQGGTGQTSDSAYASHLSSQGLIVTEVAGSTGAVSAATIISAGSIAVIGQDISDFTNDTGFIPGSAVNTNVTSISGGVITTGTINSNRINTDTLNVKHFADVSTDIINQTGGTVPLRVQAKNQQWNGSIVGGSINSVEAIYLNTTTPNVRNGATYQVVYSSVLGQTRVGTVEYSYNGSSWTSLGGVGNGSTSMNTGAGSNYRTYVFIWQGTLTGMSSSQETVYWRVRWNNFGSQLNTTYQSIYIDIDNTT
jgi:hypothetical protein